MKILAAVVFLALGLYVLSSLRKPYEQRSARWGKRGIGPKMSAFSIIVAGAWLIALAVAMLAPMLIQSVPPDLDIIVVGSGFVACIVCGITDTIIEERRNKNA